MMALDHLTQLLTQYGYLILFPISILEGPVISMLAGALVSFHILNGFLAYAVLVAGDLTGDVFYYSLGFFGRRHVSVKWQTRLGLTGERIEKLEHSFKKHDWKLLILGKTQPFGSAILFVAGLTHMPFLRFFFYNVIGTLPKALLFLLVGYYFAESYRSFGNFLNYGSYISVGVAILLLIGYWFIRRRANAAVEKN